MALVDSSRPLGAVAPAPAREQAARADRLHPDAPSRPDGLVHHGVVGYVASLVAAVLVLAIGTPDVRFVVGSLAVVVAWLAYSFAALPPYERAISFAPARRLVLVLGLAMTAKILVGVGYSEDLRVALTSCVVAAGVLAVSASVHRALLRGVPTVVVGQSDAVDRLATSWQDRRDLSVVGTCTWDGAARFDADEDALSRAVSEVMTAVTQRRARSVVIASDRAFSTPALRHMAWALQRMGVECQVVVDMQEHVEYVRPRTIGGQVALSLRPQRDRLASLMIKTAFDKVVAALLLVLLAPVMLAVGVAIRLTSDGPAVFRQERSGRDGVPFTMLKFRTMVVDAEERLASLREINEGAGPLFKLATDPRITPLGRILRRTSLDELPQLFNVLRGDMSLIGPRPALPSETADWDAWMWRRLHVRPGVTGLWQVSGRSRLSWQESVLLDLRYVNTWSLRLDAKILWRTVGAVLRRDGAL